MWPQLLSLYIVDIEGVNVVAQERGAGQTFGPYVKQRARWVYVNRPRKTKAGNAKSRGRDCAC
jgi:hypothetical protein